MSEKFSAEDRLLAQAFYLQVQMLGNRPALSDYETISLCERLMVQVKTRKNAHARDHEDKYDKNCLFCLEAVELSNEGKAPMSTKPSPAEIEKALWPKKSKYGVKQDPADRCADGIVFDSRKEMLRYQELKMWERVGIIQQGTLKLQPVFPCIVNGVKVCDVVPDFQYVSQDGKTVIEDVKGYKGGDSYTRFKLKSKLFSACYKDLRILEV